MTVQFSPGLKAVASYPFEALDRRKAAAHARKNAGFLRACAPSPLVQSDDRD